MTSVLEAYSVTDSDPGDVVVDVVVSGARIDLRVAVGSGHIPVGAREHAIDAAFAPPAAAHARVLRASIPLGDVELLDALRLRCSALRARPAGSTCLVDGVLDPS